MTPDAALVVERLVQRLYGDPIIRNDVRGELVEEIVASALEPEWTHYGGDWSSCDLRHDNSGLRIQVKQSAARQSWPSTNPTSTPRFTTAQKTGRWEGMDWIEEFGRNAEIFVLAWHPRTDDGCDHRDPSQWQFYVIAERDLPNTATCSLSTIARLTDPQPIDRLRSVVDECARSLK